MRSFYRDESRPSGWNNIVFPNVSMPHVLVELQGHQRAVYKVEKHEAEVTEKGKKVKKVEEEKVFDHFELEKPGSLSTEQFDGAMRDLTNFMAYLAEPAKLVRYRIGIVVIVFLAIFMVIAYLLKKEYWKDVH
jgi:ubiquinol-cytochrome c reductase cytochrome c1 subunit